MINLSWDISESRILPSVFDESVLEDSSPEYKSCSVQMVKHGRIESPRMSQETLPHSHLTSELSLTQKICALQTTENLA